MSKASQKVDETKGPSAIFITMALDMSWRLAFVVLVPIIGGFELDKKLNTSPALTIVGFALAMIGLGLVLWRTLQAANRIPVPKLTAAQKRALKKQTEEEEDD